MDKKYEDIKRIKGVRWLLLWVMLTQFVCLIVASAVVSFIPDGDTKKYFEYLSRGIVTVLTFLISIMVYGSTTWRKTERADAEEMRFNRFSKRLLGFIVVMAVSGQFVMILFNLPITLLTGSGVQSNPDSLGLPCTYGEVITAIIVIAILPGIFEEFWMRGIVLSVYERRSTFVAIFFTTVMFALLHGSLSKLPGVLLLGFVAALITIRTNSVYAAMLYHILNNATSVIFGYIMTTYSVGDTLIWTFIAIMAFVFFASLISFLVLSPKRKRIKCKGEGAMLIKNFLSLPVILCLVIVILKYILGNR